jgi:hypothetical protein
VHPASLHLFVLSRSRQPSILNPPSLLARPIGFSDSLSTFTRPTRASLQNTRIPLTCADIARRPATSPRCCSRCCKHRDAPASRSRHGLRSESSSHTRPSQSGASGRDLTLRRRHELEAFCYHQQPNMRVGSQGMRANLYLVLERHRCSKTCTEW